MLRLVVYIDILLILNLYINYFLIRSSALVLRRNPSAVRCLAAASVGAAASLVILLPALPFHAIALIKLSIGAIVTLVAFDRQKIVDYAICTLLFLVVSFVYGGLMMALWIFAAPFDMVYGNGVAYFNIPIAAIAAFTAAAYFIIKLVRYFADRRLNCPKICTLAVTLGGKRAVLRGLSDTGNGLTDYLSGKPVIICRKEAVSDILPAEVEDYLLGRVCDAIHLVPCRTVSSELLVPVFKAESVTVDGKQADAVVGVTQTDLGDNIDCIFNPAIIAF